jgi:hypothetical protein
MAPTTAQPPLLRDVIDIKPSISTSDFVLKLAEAVTDEGSAHALRDYVLTDRLLENFDEALGLIKASLDGHTSKAAYLHGSFGSGKSHFMAVLHALLRGNQAALSRSEFDPVLTKHEWLSVERKKFLLVPYHMLGAKSLEQRVLGGYVSHVKALHPDAPGLGRRLGDAQRRAQRVYGGAEGEVMGGDQFGAGVLGVGGRGSHDRRPEGEAAVGRAAQPGRGRRGDGQFDGCARRGSGLVDWQGELPAVEQDRPHRPGGRRAGGDRGAPGRVTAGGGAGRDGGRRCTAAGLGRRVVAAVVPARGRAAGEQQSAQYGERPHGRRALAGSTGGEYSPIVRHRPTCPLGRRAHDQEQECAHRAA